MTKLSDKILHRLDNWIPLFLLGMPTIMLAVPLFVYVDPIERLYIMPTVPKAFLIGVILYALASGGLTRLKALVPPRSITVAATGLCGVTWYTTFFVAKDPLFSAAKVLELLLLTGVAIFASTVFQRGGKALVQKMLTAIFLSVVVAVPFATLLIAYEVPGYYRWPFFVPGFDHIRIYGFSLTAAIAIGTGLLALPDFRATSARWSVILCLGLLWTALFWTSSRGGIVALIAVAPVIAVLVPKFRKPAVLSIVPLLVGAAISAQIQSDIPDIGFQNTFSEITEPVDLTGTGKGRLEEWKVAAAVTADKPFFGHGLGQAIFVVKTVVPKYHVHNIVLEALLAWGLVGAACAGYIIIRLWFSGLAKVNLPDRPEYIAAFYAISVLLVYAWVDATYLYYQATIPLAICTAVMLTPARSS